MSKPTELATNMRNAVTILSVTPYEEDQFWLQTIIKRSKWRLYRADCLESALAVLHKQEVGVLLSEKDLPPTFVDRHPVRDKSPARCTGIYCHI